MTESGQFGGGPAGPHAPYPPAAYGAPQTSTSAIAALVLAVLSWIVMPLIPAVVAMILARNAREEIAASGGRVTGEGLASAARIVAWANIALCVAAVLTVIIVLGMIGAFA
jgi:cytochrome c biogenesis protein CcdA